MLPEPRRSAVRTLAVVLLTCCFAVLSPGAAGAVGATPPLGNWEVLSASGSTVTVAGWGLDPDAPTTPVAVHVYVDGGGAAVTANAVRPDVGAAFPGAGSAHGFAHSRTVSPGVHNVCVYAIDVDNGARNTPLGCRSIAVRTTLPVANWEALSATGSTLSVVGWALDPDAPTTPVAVHVYVDGGGGAVTANAIRPDVGAAFPGAGSAHGFSSSRTVSPGAHNVCVYAIDLDNGGRNTPLGCRSITVGLTLPVANWEVLSASGSTLSVAGWALDPDDPTWAAPVHVYVDGGGAEVWADRNRPDVGAAFPGAGSAHGFSHSRTVAPGVHNVCLYAIDLNSPWRNTPLGCRSIAVGLTLPVGNWETLSTSGWTVSVAGWALDRDHPTVPVPMHVYVDGSGAALTAGGNRPDVGAAFPGAGSAHGFSWTTAVPPGVHSVCVYAIDVDNGGRNTPLGCRSVTVQSVTPAELIGAAWIASGAETGALGASLGNAQGGLAKGGYRQLFQNGAIYWTPATGARIVLSGPVRDDWVLRGGEGGQLGYPTGDTVCGLVDSGCRQDFENGALYSSAATGVNLVTGPILADWRGSAQDGYLGYPTDDAWCGLRDGGCVQYFQYGLIAWSPATGAVGLTDTVAPAWEAEGAEEGPLGYPNSPGRIDWGTGWHTGRFQHGEIVARVDPWTGELYYEVTLY